VTVAPGTTGPDARGVDGRGVDGCGPVSEGIELVERHTVFSAVVGSRAYGLDVEGSDTDIRGVFVTPATRSWSLSKPPTHVDGPAPEQFSWEVGRFCELALRQNPTVLEVPASPLVLGCTGIGRELVELQPAFWSAQLHATYTRYALAQHRKAEARLRREGSPRWKQVMHLLRVLLQGAELLSTGRLILHTGAHADRLLAVRRGELSWDQAERWRLQLHQALDAGVAITPLPAAPDAAKVGGWLRSVRERSAREELR
jgi:hypothetical protein